jgi:hypothetical protein
MRGEVVQATRAAWDEAAEEARFEPLIRGGDESAFCAQLEETL